MSQVDRRRAGSPPAKKKLVIKPFKVAPAPPAAFEEQTLTQLTTCVDAIYQQTGVSMSQEQLYRAVESLCMHKKASLLYDRLYAQCKTHIEQSVKTLNQACQTLNTQLQQTATVADMDISSSASSSSIPNPFSLSSAAAASSSSSTSSSSSSSSSSLSSAAAASLISFLHSVNTVWQSHCNQMLTIRSIYLYLDRSYVVNNSSNNNTASNVNTSASASAAHTSQQLLPTSLWHVFLILFRDALQLYPIVLSTTVQGILLCIEKERNEESIDRNLLKSLLRMFLSLRLYRSLFESKFLLETDQFYHREGTHLMIHLHSNIPDYLQHVQKRLIFESEKNKTYLDDSSMKPLLEVIEKNLIVQFTGVILERGLNELLKSKRVADLALLYRLFARVHALTPLKEAFSTYIKQAGTDIISAEGKEATMIKELLLLKDNLDDILIQSFQNNSDFIYTLKLSFEAFLNSIPNKPAEYIAKECDWLLRKGGADKNKTESELKENMDKLMFLFRYIHGKDIFQAFYKKDLAKRLLLGKSSSEDNEKAMINRLKAECGASFTTKLEGMFKDMDLSRDVQREFVEQHIKTIPNWPNDVEMGIQVLTTGSWPAYTPADVTLPAEVTMLQDEFKRFYLSKHSGRRLTFQNSLASCSLRAHFPKGKKELALSGFQGIVLLLFNEADVLSFTQIQELTKLDEMELKRTLISLSLQEEVKILLKEPRNKKVLPTDTFRVNMDFKFQLFRIKVNTVQLKETKEEQKAVTARVEEDRGYAVDACIVRVMKSRKTLTHQQLMAEVLGQLQQKFPIQPVDVKKRISSLIEREYIERDKDDSSVYNYVA